MTKVNFKRYLSFDAILLHYSVNIWSRSLQNRIKIVFLFVFFLSVCDRRKNMHVLVNIFLTWYFFFRQATEEKKTGLFSPWTRCRWTGWSHWCPRQWINRRWQCWQTDTTGGHCSWERCQSPSPHGEHRSPAGRESWWPARPMSGCPYSCTWGPTLAWRTC